MALNQAGWQVSSIAGPAFAGLLIGTSGTAAAYGVDAASYLVGFVAAILLRPLPPDTVQTQRGMAAVSEGFRYLKNHRLLQSTFVIDLVAMIFGSPQALFPVIAVQQLHRGPEAVGLLFAAPAAGALVLTLVSGPLTTLHRQGRAVVWAVVAWGAAIAGFGLAGREPDRRAGLPGDRGRGRCGERDLPLDDPAGHGPRPSPRAVSAPCSSSS